MHTHNPPINTHAQNITCLFLKIQNYYEVFNLYKETTRKVSSDKEFPGKGNQSKCYYTKFYKSLGL